MQEEKSALYKLVEEATRSALYQLLEELGLKKSSKSKDDELAQGELDV